MVYILLSVKKRAGFCKSIAVGMGGVSRYFSKVSGSGVDVTPEQRLSAEFHEDLSDRLLETNGRKTDGDMCTTGTN